MRLEKVIIQGFKSFYFKTEISILPGLTTIVGPNGAGKSNIADAIAWAMGEQSSKALRSDDMQQVISQGSKSLKPLGMAEVSLIFKENNDNRTVITRKLFKSGESIYKINGEESRLKDVLDLLSSFSLAPKSYTVIEQNKIQMLLDFKPADRRIFFDDAAGITRYKAKKKETINKLIATENNLQRIDDIILEVSQNRNSLKKQAAKTLSYQKLLSKLSETKNSLFSIKFSLLKNEMNNFQFEIDSLIKEKNSISHKITATNAEIENIKQLIIQKEDALANKSKDLNALEAKINDLEKQIAVSQANISNAEKELKNKQKLLLEYSQKRDGLISFLKKLEDNILFVNENKEKITSLLSSSILLSRHSSNILAILQNKLELENQIYYKINSEYEISLNEKTRLNNQIKELDCKANKIKSFLSGAQQGYNISNDCYDEYKRLLEQTKLAQQFINLINQKLNELAILLNDNINNCKVNEAQIKAEIGKVNLAYSQMEKILNDQFAFRAIQGYESEIVKLGISFKGFLINHIMMPKEYYKLINFLYRDVLYSAVVDSVEDLEILAKYLKDKKQAYGIICMSSFKQCERKAGKINGAVKLSEVLSIDEDLKELLYIFDDTYILEDLSSFDFGSFNRSASFYFLKEDCIYHNGSFYFINHLDDKNNAILFEHEVKKLKLDEESCYKKLHDIEQKRKKYEEYKAKIEYLSMEHSKEHKGLVNFMNNAEKLFNEYDLIKQKLEMKIKIVQAELSDMMVERNKITENLDAINIKIQFYQMQLHNKKAQLEYLKSLLKQYSNITSVLKSLTDRLQISKVKIFSLIEALAVEKNRAKEKINEINNLERQAANLIAQSKKLIERNSINQKKWNEEISELVLNKKEINDDYTKINLEKNELKAKVSALETLLKKFMQEKETLLAKFNQMDLKKTQLEMECNYLRENCLNETKKNIQYIESASEESIEELQSKISKIEKKLSLMGPINSLAVQEYEEINKKYEFLNEQRKDIAESCITLKKAVEKLDLYMKDKLITALEHVNKYINEYFHLIFKGGNIEMYFEDSDNILDSPIEFKIKMPNKRVNTIQSLSGGEKSLIALLFLFSIFKYKPSFFCVWDEIDAALDDANIVNIINIFNQLKSQVQFIIISHNKLMMEASDQLYGVTMEEEGVSKVYSVKIADLRENNTIAV